VPFPSSKPFRKKANWLAALAVEALAPALRAYARLQTGRSCLPSLWRKALIIGDNHIGDLLYRSASLGALKVGLPDCEFHYLAAPGSSQIIEGHPALASILPWLRSDSPLDLAPEHLATLKAMRFDAALCTNCIKYWPELLLALRLGIPNRAGYVYKGFSGWVTHPMPIRFPQSYPAYFRDYVAGLTGQPGKWSLRPVIHSTADDEAAAGELWERLGLGRHKRLIACFMTTRQPTGVWPPKNFGKALQMLRPSAGIVLCGAADDRALLERIAAGVPVFFFRNLRSDPVETGAYLDSETDFCPGSGWLEPERHAGILAGITPESVASVLKDTKSKDERDIKDLIG